VWRGRPVDAVDDARDRVSAEADADGLAGQHVVGGPELTEGARPGAFFEMLPRAEERGDDAGDFAIEIERGAERRFERTGDGAEVGGEILGRAGEVKS